MAKIAPKSRNRRRTTSATTANQTVSSSNISNGQFLFAPFQQISEKQLGQGLLLAMYLIWHLKVSICINSCLIVCCYRSEMRLRLGFLRRRSTESSLSARPPPEEAQKWSESFTSLMASKCKSIYIVCCNRWKQSDLHENRAASIKCRLLYTRENWRDLGLSAWPFCEFGQQNQGRITLSVRSGVCFAGRRKFV